MAYDGFGREQGSLLDPGELDGLAQAMATGQEYEMPTREELEARAEERRRQGVAQPAQRPGRDGPGLMGRFWNTLTKGWTPGAGGGQGGATQPPGAAGGGGSIIEQGRMIVQDYGDLPAEVLEEILQEEGFTPSEIRELLEGR